MRVQVSRINIRRAPLDVERSTPSEIMIKPQGITRFYAFELQERLHNCLRVMRKAKMSVLLRVATTIMLLGYDPEEQ